MTNLSAEQKNKDAQNENLSMHLDQIDFHRFQLEKERLIILAWPKSTLQAKSSKTALYKTNSYSICRMEKHWRENLQYKTGKTKRWRKFKYLTNPISWAHWASALLHCSPSMAKTIWNMACEISVEEDNIRTDHDIKDCWWNREPIGENKMRYWSNEEKIIINLHLKY